MRPSTEFPTGNKKLTRHTQICSINDVMLRHATSFIQNDTKYLTLSSQKLSFQHLGFGLTQTLTYIMAKCMPTFGKYFNSIATLQCFD